MSRPQADGDAALPPLTGTFAVGVVRVHLPGENELVARVYYPAEPGRDGASVPYVWDPDVLVPGLAARFVDLGARFDEDRLRAMRAHAILAAPLARRGAFPVVVFSHGKRAALVQNVTRVEDLASHGYVVIGLENPGGAFATVMPDGRVVPFDDIADDQRRERWITEIAAAIERLPVRVAAVLAGWRECVDPGRVGLMGRAFGGTVALHAAARVGSVAVANLGGPAPIDDAPRQPYLQLDPPATAGRARPTCARSGGPAYLVSLKGLGTTGLSDTPYLPWVVPPPDRVTGSIDRLRAAEIVGHTIATFFDRHLRDDASASVVALASRYPELSVEAWRV